jgi:hypothetical protein
MRSTRDSDISIACGDGLTAYERARRVLRLGELAIDESTAVARLIMHVASKPPHDPTAVSEQAMTEAVLYLRKKYSEG